jgi:hypothetical protein
VAVQHSIFTIRDPRCHAHVLHTREQFRLRPHAPKPNGDLKDTIMYLTYLVWMVAPWKEQRRKPSPSCGRGEKPTVMASTNGIRKGWIRKMQMENSLKTLTETMETRTVKPRNQLPNTLLPLMPMVVIIDRLCHVHQDLGELFGYFYDRLSRL